MIGASRVDACTLLPLFVQRLDQILIWEPHHLLSGCYCGWHHSQLLFEHVPSDHSIQRALNGITVKYFSLNSTFTWQDPLCHL